MNHSFDFSVEADVRAVYDAGVFNKIWLEWPISGRPSLLVGSFTSRPLRDGYRELQTDFVDGRRMMLRLTEGLAHSFMGWVLDRRSQTQAFIELPNLKVDTYTFTMPQAPKASCPVCYGTGFHKGFGAPCAKGCKAP